MKKTMIMAIALAITAMAGVRAQDTVQTGYRSFFGSESTEWHVDEKDYDVWGLNYRYIIGADTVISGLNYRTLEVWRVFVSAPSTYQELYVDEYRSGFVREDTLEGKLWVRNAITGDEERLVVDMSLSVGDTFWSENRQGSVLSIVRGVYMDSLGRKVVELSDYEPMYFIEGVGASSCFLGGGLYSNTYCIFHNDTLTYRNMDSWDLDTVTCWGTYSVGIDGNQKNAALVFPNPAHDLINIEASNVCSITLYDIRGNMIKRYNGSWSYIDISEISCGFIIVRITTNNGVIHKQIIKI